MRSASRCPAARASRHSSASPCRSTSSSPATASTSPSRSSTTTPASTWATATSSTPASPAAKSGSTTFPRRSTARTSRQPAAHDPDRHHRRARLRGRRAPPARPPASALRDHLRHLLASAAYGMPELRGLSEGSLVANPGCYPTAILLATAPLFAAGLAEPDSLVADAKSGVSGAGGRSAMDASFSFAALSDNFRAYSVTGHRHTAEMEQELDLLSRTPVTMLFTPHLLPVLRGILATCYVRLRDP